MAVPASRIALEHLLMSTSPSNEHPLSELMGELVVIDASSPYVFLGRLVGESSTFIMLDEVDVHDLRDTTTTRDQYVLNVRAHGIRPNRRRSWVNLSEVVGISRLEDVMID